MECPDSIKACEPFLLDYNFTSTDTGYPYEVRKYYTETTSPLEAWDDCIYDEDITPDCVENNANFSTICPVGGATILRGGRAVADIHYYVQCLSSSTINIGRCDAEPDPYGEQECKVECEYDVIDYDLVFNVTAPPTTSAECELFLWYNKSGSWCQIYPKPSEACATPPYQAIVGGAEKVVIPEMLSVFHLTDVVSPTRYMWNVRCVGVAGVAMAPENWKFTAVPPSC